ncbi:hypothetical protein AGLY_006755 [Aphis glycines]|uniref:Transposable element P transposase-like GTP-binding insertion domain-containing protein n=1 Tax=Aphis glycines TaxID=307491 RepID=A0A6G0TQQ4_APHGL|nr:hypothetical protein AGLY_006755 [Aphis glycines]
MFSATVAAGMRTCIKCNTLSIAAETTVNFIDNMDKLFDLLNSKPKADDKEFNLPFKNGPTQKNHLIIMLNIFKNMRVIETKTVNGITTKVDVTQRMKFINGWQITINKTSKYSMSILIIIFCGNTTNHDNINNDVMDPEFHPAMIHYVIIIIINKIPPKDKQRKKFLVTYMGKLTQTLKPVAHLIRGPEGPTPPMSI